jgi:trafficking protein particle complex subunit 10
VLEQGVDEALSECPQYQPNRSRLIALMIQALESDPSWVELYDITGELKVPTSKNDDAPEEILSRVREVGYPISH